MFYSSLKKIFFFLSCEIDKIRIYVCHEIFIKKGLFKLKEQKY